MKRSFLSDFCAASDIEDWFLKVSKTAEKTRSLENRPDNLLTTQTNCMEREKFRDFEVKEDEAEDASRKATEVSSLTWCHVPKVDITSCSRVQTRIACVVFDIQEGRQKR